MTCPFCGPLRCTQRIDRCGVDFTTKMSLFYSIEKTSWRINSANRKEFEKKRGERPFSRRSYFIIHVCSAAPTDCN